MRESSLDDFLGDDGPAAPTDDVDSIADGGDEADSITDGVDDPDSIADGDSAATTYAWTPDGAECAECGATVERRWRDGDELVCSDCKPW